MPIKYVQTLGAVAGIVQVVNAVEITCSKPAALARSASGRPGFSKAPAKPSPLQITVRPTLTPDYGGD